MGRIRIAVIDSGVNPNHPHISRVDGGFPDDFLDRLGHSSALGRVLGPLGVKGGTVQRQVFLTSFPDLVRELAPGDDPGSSAGVPLATVNVRPFEGHTGHVLCIAFSPDGKVRRHFGGGLFQMPHGLTVG